MKAREDKDKNKLTIRLAEPVVYLKDVDFSGRDRTHNELSPPSMVRGILTLHLSKPTKICSIDVELTAKSSMHYSEVVVGSRRVEVTEEHQLYSSSTVYFRQEAEEHPSRRAISLGPTSTRSTTIEEGDTYSTDFDIDHEDSEIPHGQRSDSGPSRGRRGASVDLRNFHRDVVSQHTTTRIPSPAYNPSADNTPQGSPASSAANLSENQPTPPPDQGSPSHPRSSSHVRPSSSSAQRDQRSTISGTSNDSIPSPVSQWRASQVLEDFWRALRSDPSVASVRPITPRIDTSALVSPTFSPPLQTPVSETPSRKSEGFDDCTHGRRRSKSRFSLSVISDAIIDSVKSHSPLATRRRDEGTPTRSDVHDGEKSGESSRGRSREKSKGKGRDLSHALTKVGEVFGLEPEEPRDGWKEFKKGTYTYPISFPIPADSPPSLGCAYGSIVWTLKATVHRPGKFTPRMEATRIINVVATPSDDATEDVENVTVNKTWEDQMVYYLSIVGRAFPIGGKIPIQLTFMPLAKVKILKVSIVIDEKVTYYTQMTRVAKTPSATRQVLCCLKYPEKNHTPILPLTEEDPRKSPLYRLVHEDLEHTGQSEQERASQLTSEWMGPGPWPLRMNVEISNNCGSLRPTSMNKKGNITVCHVLKIIIRAEKENAGGAEDSKKKTYDIIIQYPFHLLSPLCNQKFTSLPPYSLTWNSVPMAPGQPSPSEPNPSSVVHEVSAIELEPPTPDYTDPTIHILRATSRERETVTHQFDRLVSGQEAETGEAPPPYGATTPSIHPNNPHPLRV